jgi:hypothetical protein
VWLMHDHSLTSMFKVGTVVQDWGHSGKCCQNAARGSNAAAVTCIDEVILTQSVAHSCSRVRSSSSGAA